MRTARENSPVIAAAALAVAGLAATGLAVAAPAAATPGDTVVINCSGKGVVKPKEITLTCADAGVTVTKISWSTWTANGATGSGTLAWNTCLPETCADGIVQSYRVRIALGRVASGPNVTAFSKMTLRFPGGGGPAGAQTSTYTLDNPVR